MMLKVRMRGLIKVIAVIYQSFGNWYYFPSFKLFISQNTALTVLVHAHVYQIWNVYPYDTGLFYYIDLWEFGTSNVPQSKNWRHHQMCQWRAAQFRHPSDTGLLYYIDLWEFGTTVITELLFSPLKIYFIHLETSPLLAKGCKFWVSVLTSVVFHAKFRP